MAAEGGSGAKQAGESEHKFPPETFEARGAVEGCCRHLTFEVACSDGVWLAMARCTVALLEWFLVCELVY